MRAAIILNGVVENVVLVGPEFSPEGDRTLVELPEDSTVSVGWAYDGTTFIPQEVVPPVPTAVTARQARLALLGAGLLDSVEAVLAGMEGPQGAAARIEWEYALEIQRVSPLIDGLAPALGLTDAQIDDLFRAAVVL